MQPRARKDYLAKLLSGVFMVFGTTVGAGMLGIPAVTALSGFLPALVVTFLVWVFMAVTGLLLLEVTLKMPQGSNLISLSSRFLGRVGKWVSGFLFLFLYYCLLVAYFSGGAPLLGQLFTWIGFSIPSLMEFFVFSLLFGGIVCLGVKWINKMNLILTFCMIIAYVFLIVFGSQGVHLSLLANHDFSLAVGAVPILFSAFGFHNVVPPLATYLERDKKILRLSVVLGTFFAFLLYVIWQWLVLGSIPIEALNAVREKGLPITYALQGAIKGSHIYVLGQLFAFFALTTSFLGVGFSFVDFIQDGFQEGKLKISRFSCSLITLLPPFLCVLWIPSLFEKALGLAGGFGESILNGILPVLLFIKMRSSLQKHPLSYSLRSFLAFLILLSLGVIFVELAAII